MSLVHGHEVMQLINQSPECANREELIKHVIATFGPDTRFFNCSATDLTASQIVTFFETKGKIQFSDGGIKFGPGEGCHH